jgi:hypothetical protein
MLFNSTVCKV